jgi:hypothetical protein
MLVEDFFTFGVFCFSCNYLYKPMHATLSDTFGTAYGALPSRKQQYCCKNVIKGVALGCVMPYAIYNLADGVSRGKWDHHTLKVLGSLYTSLDVVAMWRMYVHLPLSTKIHHSCVVVFNGVNLLAGDMLLTPSSAWYGLISFASLSTVTWMVNMYLGFRYIKPVFLRPLCVAALTSYVPVFLLNLGMQVQHGLTVTFTGFEGVSNVIYFFLIACVLYDDWLLIHHLKKTCSA